MDANIRQRMLLGRPAYGRFNNILVINAGFFRPAKVAVIVCVNIWRFLVWCGSLCFSRLWHEVTFVLSLIRIMTRVVICNVFRMINCIGRKVIMHVS